MLIEILRGELIDLTGKEIFLSNIGLNIQFKSHEEGILKKEYAGFGWILPPHPETHELFSILDGVELEGIADVSSLYKLISLTGVLNCNNGKVSINANIIVIEQTCSFDFSTDNYLISIRFRNVDNEIKIENIP